MRFKHGLYAVALRMFVVLGSPGDPVIKAAHDRLGRALRKYEREGGCEDEGEVLPEPWSRTFAAVLNERNYQLRCQAEQSQTHIQPQDLTLGEMLQAMDVQLRQAQSQWYYGSGDFHGAMECIRKIMALGLQAGEKFPMPMRDESGFQLDLNLFNSECEEPRS